MTALRGQVVTTPRAVGEMRSKVIRIDSLTGVRILAASGVFLSHVGAPAFAPGPLRSFMAAGYNGVTLFFVLSGFVLAWNYGDRMARLSLHSTWSFFVARIARIYPLYLFALLWATAPGLVVAGLDSGILLHVLAVQTWSPDVYVAFANNGPGWSIGVEFFLYACFPVVILGLARIRSSPRRLLLVAAMTFALVWGLAWWFTATGRAALPTTDPESAHRWLYRMPLTRLGDFVSGAATALLVSNFRPRPWIALLAQAVGAGGFVVLMTQQSLLFTAWSWDAAYLIPTSLLLWGLATGPRVGLSRFLSSKTMVLLGEASFAFYLLHFPLIGRLGFTGVDTWRGWLLTVGLQFVMILLVAIGAHVLIERPAQRWLRRVLDRRPSTRVVGAEAQLTPTSLNDQVLI